MERETYGSRFYGYNIEDPAEEEVWGYCDGCGGEIYKGEEVYEYNNLTTHKNSQCFYEAIMENYTAKDFGIDEDTFEYTDFDEMVELLRPYKTIMGEEV